MAVKWFRIDLPPERVHQLVAGFEQLIAADLSYPSIAAPLATGIVEASAYLALDFVAADSLDVVIRNSGPTQPAEALRIVGQMAGALDYAADAGIDHGALHPRDVLISADDVRVTGIGIARALERAGYPLAARRPYSAPERVAGAAWDRTADVFSIGALTVELLTGRRIAGVGEQAAAAIGDVPGVDRAALTAILARALAERHEERQARAGDVADALHDVLSVPPVASRIARRRKKLPEDPPIVSVPPPALPLALDDLTRDVAPVGVESSSVSPGGPVIGAPVVERPSLGEPTPEVFGAPASSSHDTGDDLALQHPAVPEHDEPMHVASTFAEPDAMVAPADAGIDREDEIDRPVLSVLEQSRSAVWPLGLALVVGIAIGFGLAVVMLGRDHPVAALDPQAPVATASRPPTDVSEPPLVVPNDSATPTPAPSGAVANGPAGPAAAAPPATAGSTVAPVAPAATTPSRPARETVPVVGRIVVRSTPAGARIFLDGASRGVTPSTLADVARGPHTVRLTHDGYRSVERRVTITESRASETLQIELARMAPAAPARGAVPAPAARTPTAAAGPAALTIDSRPVGARVVLDGRAVGRTPLTLRTVPPGEHTVQLELDGFRPWISSVKVVAGEQNKVAGSLER